MAEESLNDLIFESQVDAVPVGAEVLVALSAKSKGADGVRILAGEGTRLGRFVDRVKAFNAVKGAMLISTDQAVLFEKIRIKAEEVTSEVPFEIELALGLRTPKMDDEPKIQRMAHGFRDATLRKPGQAVSANVANGPQSILRSELENWLRATYRTKEQLARHDDKSWLEEQAEVIRVWLSVNFGLDGYANLKLRAPNKDLLRVDGLEVRTKPKDSDTDIKVNVWLSARLESAGVFDAPALTQEDLGERIMRIVDHHMRECVSLQSFRFSNSWQSKLRDLVKDDLEPYERELVEFKLSPPLNDYRAGPYSIRAGEATFQPAGWDNIEGRDDRISFSCDANIMIADAAKFERMYASSGSLLGGLAISRTEDVLQRWLGRELQEAVRETLHPIHRDDQGYAKLLSDWTGEKGFRAQIEENLKTRATQDGLEVQNIVATPAREEMRLLEGAIISIPSRAYTSSADSVDIEFSAEVEIRVESFNDIRGILNRTNNPLDEIREKHIVKPLERYVRQIAYIEFFKNFEYGPWPAKADEKEAAGKDSGCVGWLKSKLKDSLAGPSDVAGEKIELVDLTLHQSTTVHFEVFERLTKTIPQRVNVKLDIVALGSEHVTDPYNIAFDLSITGLSAQNTEVFFRDWEAISGNQSEYAAILEDCRTSFAFFFSAEARDQFFYAHEEGENGKDRCEAIVRTQLSKYLAEKYGLSGNAVSIAVENTGLTSLKILEQTNAIEEERIRLRLMKEARVAQAEEKARAIKARAKLAADERIKDVDASGGEGHEALGAPPEDFLSERKLTSRVPKRLPPRKPDASQDGETDESGDA